MSQRGISFRLNSQVTVIAVIIISVIVYINYHFTKKVLIGKIEEGAVNQSNLVISSISRITVGTEEIAKNVSFQALYFYQHNDIGTLLKQVAKANPILESVHVEFPEFDNARFTVCSNEEHCKRRCNNSDSIFAADSLGNGIWSKPFYCGNDTTHLLVAYRYPIFKPETRTIIGHVYCEVSLRKIRQMLSQIPISHNGYAFLADETGLCLTHPDLTWILKKNIYSNPFFTEETKTEIQTVVRSGQSMSKYGISEYFNNKPAWFYFARLVNTNWITVIVIPESELFKEIHQIFQKILWVCGLGIIFLFIINMLIFSWVLTPLARVSEAIYQFSSIPGGKKNTKDEVKILKDSLENWQEKYGKLITEKDRSESEKVRYEKELKSARDIQQNIVPEGRAKFLDHPEIDLFATLMPAGKVGGDLYDYFFIDKTHLLIAIGDVSGKGIPASLFMAVASTLIKTNAKLLQSRDIVAEVNKELSNRNTDQYFLTLFVGVLDLETGKLDFCNAAHNYPYILHQDGTIDALSKSHGLPLGIYRDKTYKSSSVELVYDDKLILFTDGLINSIDDKNNYYGTGRLENNLLNMSDLSSEEIVNKLISSLSIFKGDMPQSDDISILIFRYLNNKKIG